MLAALGFATIIMIIVLSYGSGHRFYRSLYCDSGDSCADRNIYRQRNGRFY